MTRPGPLPTPRRWRNAPPTRESDPTQPRWLALFLGILAIAAAPLLVYVLTQNQHVDARYRIQRLREAQDRLVQGERRLRVEAARLGTPSRVEQEARDRLGLVRPPAGHQVVLLPPPGRGGLMARAPDSAQGTDRR